jgi:hypothetical protein
MIIKGMKRIFFRQNLMAFGRLTMLSNFMSTLHRGQACTTLSSYWQQMKILTEGCKITAQRLL